MNISNLSIRQKQIFKILLNVEDFIPCKDIASKLNVSIRTVKADVVVIKNSLKSLGSLCVFESKSSKGYRIRCSDIEKVKTDYLTDNYFFILNKYLEDDYRQINMFFDLLNSEGLLKVKDLAEKYYISRTTLYKDLDTLGKELKDYNIELIYEPYRGVYIRGTEINIRFAAQNKLLLSNGSFEEDFKLYFGDFKFTKNNLLEFINSFAINKISDFELSNLFHHLLVILMRCKINKYISIEDLYYKTFINEFEIERAYQYFYKYKFEYLTIPRSEIIYFVLLIKGCNLGFCNQIALDVTTQALMTLSEQLRIDLSDSSRIAGLSRYIYSLLIRNFNHFTQNSVLIDDIKDKQSLSFELSFRMVTLIEDVLKINIANKEIAYLSYFFLDIGEQLKPYYIPSRILMVSFRGTIMCKSLLQDLQSNFNLYQFEICELYELEQKIKEKHYSFIITDVAVHINQNIPIILIGHFLASEDYKLVRKHLRIILSDLIDDYLENKICISLSNKFDFLKYISKTKEEYEYLVSRENRFTYQLKDVAIVYLFNQDSHTAIYYNSEGIIWDTKNVKYIFVINVTERNNLVDYYKIVNTFLKKVNSL